MTDLKKHLKEELGRRKEGQFNAGRLIAALDQLGEVLDSLSDAQRTANQIEQGIRTYAGHFIGYTEMQRIRGYLEEIDTRSMEQAMEAAIANARALGDKLRQG